MRNQVDKFDIWPMLLEKAFAKVHGSYEALVTSDASSALSVLTGAPTHTIDNAESDNVGETIAYCIEQGFIVIGTAKEECSDEILDGHSYAVLDAHLVKS